jgi:hypothetical protein
MKTAIIFLVIAELCRYFGGQSALDTVLIVAIAALIYEVIGLSRATRSLEQEFEARARKIADGAINDLQEKLDDVSEKLDDVSEKQEELEKTVERMDYTTSDLQERLEQIEAD